ncbi:MAG: cupin domain-containing protein [Sphingobium sp.]|nr:cupin domain-containing protein [Sphingobium sp.]
MTFPLFDVDLFLREYWQKRPLLIRDPWARAGAGGWANPLEPDELAGLACEAGVEARLIIGAPHGAGAGAAPALTMESGPFAAERFASLPAGPWTLLVQAVDHHVPDVAALIAPFRFVPDWRIDDVMVSYASDGGGVGPHYDQYDVFLVQGLGRRRWRVGPRCDAATPLLPHPDLRLIADFDASGEWVLEPGDMLYVPPGFAHDGVAVGDDCMTYSIGFRAPARADLVEEWAQARVDAMVEDDRYADPDLRAATHPGEIDAAAIDRLHALVMEAMGDRAAFARWFGAWNSQPKYPDIDWRPEEPVTGAQVREALVNGATLRRNPASRYAFLSEEGGTVQLFVDGERFACTGAVAALARDLCAAGASGQAGAPIAAKDADALALIVALINRGSLALDDGMED